jgi:hypothetical protein
MIDRKSAVPPFQILPASPYKNSTRTSMPRGNGNGDKYVVLGLGLHRQCNLIDTQADPAGHAISERPFPVQPRISDTKKLSKSSDYSDLGSVYGKKAPESQKTPRRLKEQTHPSQAVPLFSHFSVRHTITRQLPNQCRLNGDSPDNCRSGMNDSLFQNCSEAQIRLTDGLRIPGIRNDRSRAASTSCAKRSASTRSQRFRTRRSTGRQAWSI